MPALAFAVSPNCAQAPGATTLDRVDDGVNMTGFASFRMLDALDIPATTIKSWGGKLIFGEAPWDIVPRVTSGEADAILFEAVMTPYWSDMCAVEKNEFPAIDDSALRSWSATSAGSGRKFQSTDFPVWRRRSRRSTFLIFFCFAGTIFPMTSRMSSPRCSAKHRKYWKANTATFLLKTVQ